MGGINSGRRRTVHRGAVEHYPALDLRILRRARLMRPSECTYDTLTWQNQASRASSVRIFVDLSDADDASVRLKGDGIAQDIKLIATPSGFGGVRHHMLCPITGRPCEVLYLVDGIFASRQAHRLTYASQSEDQLGRVRRKARKLHRRLSGDLRYARPRGRNLTRRVKQHRQSELKARKLYFERLAKAVDSSWTSSHF